MACGTQRLLGLVRNLVPATLILGKPQSRYRLITTSVGSVYIAGVGMTRFGNSSQTLAELFCEAASRALEDSPVQDIDALYVGVMNPEEFTGDSNIASQIADALGMTGVPALRVETASSAGAAALHAAFQAVASGYYRHVLVLGGEKMTHLSTSATTRILAKVIDKQERQCGATMPALAAMITERYRKRYRLSHSHLERMLCRVAIKNHRNGSHNPYAQFQQPISEATYFSSKFVSTPLRLYDCSPITDGAAAVILTSEPTDLVISGVGHGTGPLSLRERDSFSSFRATQIAAARAYQMARISPNEIDFAEVHDAFTTFEIITTEDLGFFPAGKGGNALEEGKTSPEGALPINPSGGLKARGHPVGASGVAQVVEAVWRLRGNSEVKPRREAKRALTQSTGGLGTNNFVTILERTDSPPQIQNPWTARPQPHPDRRRSQQSSISVHYSDEGRIETFTILYVTPDGFLPPLALALIRDRQGRLLMAQGEDISHLKIGREVYLRQVAGTYLFTVKSHLRKVKDALKKLLGAPLPCPPRREQLPARKRIMIGRRPSREEKRFRSITTLLVEELKGAILKGKFAPGERLSEERLASSLKVSRVPLREALRRLETEGYITFLSNNEVAISNPTLEDIQDYYSIASVLEGLAARLAVERINSEELSRLRELHQLLKEVYQKKDLERYFEANSNFHRFIAEIARNERLYCLVDQMRQEIQKTRIISLYIPRRLDYSMREHDQILDAFLKRNPGLAEATVVRHLNNQMGALKTCLDLRNESGRPASSEKG